MRTHIGDLPLAPFAILARIYGAVVYRLPPADFDRYCAERCTLRRREV